MAKVNPQDVDALVTKKTFTLLPSGKVMICEITLPNGFVVTGQAGVVDLAEFSRDIGEQVAYENALNQVWMIAGYQLQERLHQVSQA